LNDYPADPQRDKITDRDRVYPGDGIAPLTQILRDLLANGSRAVLSLELFNPTCWKQDPLEVAKTGLSKMKAAVHKALDAHRQANSQPGQSSGVNGTTAVPAKASGPFSNQVTIDYKYVASKNSQVFHKPDCRWAKEISTQNLVGYDTREQAIEAGKKPCRWCKP
jgi:hypothetical protein